MIMGRMSARKGREEGPRPGRGERPDVSGLGWSNGGFAVGVARRDLP